MNLIIVLIVMVSVILAVTVTRSLWGKILKDQIDAARMRFDDPEGCRASKSIYLEIRQLFYGLRLMFIPRDCRRLDLIHDEAVASLNRRILWTHKQFMLIRMSSNDTASQIRSAHKRNRRLMFRDLKHLIALAPKGHILLLPRYVFPWPRGRRGVASAS